MNWKSRKRIWCGLPWTFTIYSFDDERFYLQRGLLNQRNDEVRLYRVMDISYTRSLIQRIFGLGTIHLNTSDKSLGNFDIVNIKKVSDVKEMLSQAIEHQRDIHGVRSREYMEDDDNDFDDDNH